MFKTNYFNTDGLCITGTVTVCDLNPACFNLKSFITCSLFSSGESECLFCLVCIFLIIFGFFGLSVISRLVIYLWQISPKITAAI